MSTGYIGGRRGDQVSPTGSCRLTAKKLSWKRKDPGREPWIPFGREEPVSSPPCCRISQSQDMQYTLCAEGLASGRREESGGRIRQTETDRWVGSGCQNPTETELKLAYLTRTPSLSFVLVYYILPIMILSRSRG